MTIVTPDRTEQVRGKTVRTVTRGKEARFLVVADASRAGATIMHLIEMGPENEMATALPVIEAFATEEDARSTYPQITDRGPDDASGITR